MDDLYRDFILDHYRNPRNYGRLPQATLTHEESNPLCGDKMLIDLQLDGDRVIDASFEGKGCAISQASASILTDALKGMSIKEIEQLTRQDILDNLGIDQISPARLKCALLSLKTVRKGLNEQGYDEDETEE